MKNVVRAAMLIAGLVLAVPAVAKDKAGGPMPPVFSAVVDCRAIVDGAERLACFDRTVAAMDQATVQKNLVVFDRAAVEETKKGLFGFSLPRLKLFGGADSGEEIQKIDTTLVAVRGSRDGMIFDLQDQGRWKQTAGPVNIYKPGDKVQVRRSAFGSYFATIGNWPSIRVMRLSE